MVISTLRAHEGGIVAVTTSTSSIYTDPLRDFNFNVVIQPNDPTSPGGAITMGWQTISGLGFHTDPIPYRQGGSNLTIQQMPSQVTWNPVVFSRGVVMGSSQIQIGWMLEIMGFIQSVGNANATAAPSSNPVAATAGGAITQQSDFRAAIYIYVNEHPNTTGSPRPKAGIKLYNAWPYDLQYGSLDAGSNSLFIYSMTFSHEGFDAVVAGTNDVIPSMVGTSTKSNNWLPNG